MLPKIRPSSLLPLGLGRASWPPVRSTPLKCFRRHLFVSGDAEFLPRDAPLVWDLDIGYYVRPEGAGLLLCPCDETEHPPGMPAVDPEAEALLADKLLKHAPGLADISLRRSWACLRTFAPDRLPVIGWDPEIDGLFHVSGLGGFGVTTSLAIGDVASTLICGGVVDWIEVGSFSARRRSPQVNSAVQQLKGEARREKSRAGRHQVGYAAAHLFFAPAGEWERPESRG